MAHGRHCCSCVRTPKNLVDWSHFTFYVSKRACCVACIARAFICFCFWIPLSHPSTLGRAFGFIVQIAASISLLLIFRADGRLGHWARHVFDERRKKDRLSGGDMCFLSKLLLYIWERSDVWDYSEAFTKRYILFGSVGRLLFSVRFLLSFLFTQHSCLPFARERSC